MKSYLRSYEVFVFLLMLGIALLLNSGCSAYCTENDGISKLVAAEESVFQAFERLLEAEESGANVSVLNARLNEAGNLLAEAEILCRNGNAHEAVGLAHQAVMIANDVQSQALELKNSTLKNKQDLLRFSLTCSLVGISVFLWVLFFAWKLFRRVYARRILRMKPEVV